MPVIKSSFFDRIVLWYVWRIAPLPFRTEGCGNLTQEEYVYEKETVDFDFNGCPWHVGGSGGCGQKETETVTIRIGSLKGPTSMGLVSLMDQTKNGEAGQNYEFTMAAAADEINAAFLKGDLDIVLIPANVASVLYHKTEGQIAVVDINTLGVLYLLESKETVSSVADLAGRTVYLPGKERPRIMPFSIF